MRVLVCGGRDFADQAMLCGTLDRIHGDRPFSVVIAGGARGADTLAADWAKDRGIPTEIYMAEWERLGRKAGPLRNQRMLIEGAPDLVIAFPGGRGTTNMISQARDGRVEVMTV